MVDCFPSELRQISLRLSALPLFSLLLLIASQPGIGEGAPYSASYRSKDWAGVSLRTDPEGAGNFLEVPEKGKRRKEKCKRQRRRQEKDGGNIDI